MSEMPDNSQQILTPSQIHDLNDRMVGLGDNRRSFRDMVHERESHYQFKYSFFDPSNADDMKFLQEVYRRPHASEFMYAVEGKTIEQMKIEAMEQGQTRETPLMLKVSIPIENGYKPIARLYFYYGPEEQDRYARMQENNFVDNSDAIIYEAGIVTHLSAPQGYGGKIIREGINFLRTFIDEHFDGVRGLALRIFGFIEKGNNNSLRATDMAGFQHLGELPYEPGSAMNDYVYMTEVKPQNG